MADVCNPCDRRWQMRVLTDDEVNADLTLLDQAWSEPETFAFLPRKHGLATGWIEHALEAIPPQMSQGHFALLTSGSTGLPKLVVGARARAEAIVEVLHTLQASGPVARSFLMLPLTYCYAFVNQWLWARRHGRELVQTRGFADPQQLETLLDRTAEAMLCLVGGQAAMLPKLFGDRTFSGIIRLHFAGGRFPQEHLDRLERMFPEAAIFNNYGCAEAMPRLTLRPARASDSALNIGTPLPGIELATTGSGELSFRSPYAAVGFVDGDGWQGVRSDAFVATGDFAARAERGQWILSGRANEVFKRYGEKIAIPQILERLLPAWPGQMASYQEADRSGEQGFVLVLCPVATEVQVHAILRLLRAHFTRSHWPLRIESVPAIPLLANGKPNPGVLRNDPSKTMHWHQRV